MGKVYQSVRGIVQGTLNRTKPDLVVFSKANDTNLSEVMEEVEKMFVDGIGRLKAAVTDDHALAASEAQRVERVVEGLRANIAALEAKLREAEETVQRKDADSQRLAESLDAEIRDLQSAVKQKEEALESRDAEVSDLKSKTEVLTKQISQSELASEQVKTAAASEAQRVERVVEGLRAQITMLQTQVRQKEQIVKAAGSTIKGVEQNRDRQIIELNAELDAPTNGMKEIPLGDGTAKASPGIVAPHSGTVTAAEQVEAGEEKTAVSGFAAAGVTSIVRDAAREIVAKDAFERLIAEFSERANVIRSIAALIMRHHVRSLGESMEAFPKRRLPELFESLSKEIADEKVRDSFRKRFGRV